MQGERRLAQIVLSATVEVELENLYGQDDYRDVQKELHEKLTQLQRELKDDP